MCLLCFDNKTTTFTISDPTIVSSVALEHVRKNIGK